MHEILMMLGTPTMNAIISTSAGIIIGALATKVKSMTAEKEAAKKAADQADANSQAALLALLHGQIYDLAESYIVRGWITLKELDNLTYLYTPYARLGGNGTGKGLFEKCKNLPMREEGPDE